MKEPRPVVTDHALLRYLQRVIGIDVEVYRREIEDRVAPAVRLGANALISGGWRYKLCEDRCTTVTPIHHDPEFPQQNDTDEEGER